MNTLLQSTKLYQNTVAIALLTASVKTGTTTLTTIAQPGVADRACLQMGVCFPNLKM